MAYQFPKSLRLRKQSDFQQAFDKKYRQLNSKYFTLILAKPFGSETKLGVIIAKRNVKHAVTRNQIKRVVRESFRLNVARLPLINVLVIAKASSREADKRELRRCIDGLFKQAEK